MTFFPLSKEVTFRLSVGIISTDHMLFIGSGAFHVVALDFNPRAAGALSEFVIQLT